MYLEEQVDYCSFTIHTIRIVERFLNTGNVAKGKSTGHPTVATPDVLNKVNERVAENPHISVRRLSQQIELSYETTCKILKRLHLHPYKFTIVQQLHPPDFILRTQFCYWCNYNLHNNIDQQNITFYLDDAWFHLSGYVNS